MIRAWFPIACVALVAACTSPASNPPGSAISDKDMRQAEDKKSYVVEYYGSFAGYKLPLHLINKITKEQAEGDAERAAYYIGYFDADRKLVRVVKMFGGHMVFEQKYSYYPNGRLKREEGRNQSGTVTVLEFDESGKLKK